MDAKSAIKNLSILLVIGLFFHNGLQAQGSVANRVDELMEEAIIQMNDGRYETANLTFRRILKLDAVLPDELSYLFAETLYMVDQYHNSRRFVYKYIRLAGPNGRYYSQAMDLKMYLDEEYELILICKKCDHRGYKLLPCNSCNGAGKIHSECFYCFGVGVNRCEVCKGQGVTTSLDAFSKPQYHTCQDCQGKGQVSCKVCHGKKELFQNCQTCNGTNHMAGNELCDHNQSEFGQFTVEQ